MSEPIVHVGAYVPSINSGEWGELRQAIDDAGLGGVYTTVINRYGRAVARIVPATATEPGVSHETFKDKLRAFIEAATEDCTATLDHVNLSSKGLRFTAGELHILARIKKFTDEAE